MASGAVPHEPTAYSPLSVKGFLASVRALFRRVVGALTPGDHAYRGAAIGIVVMTAALALAFGAPLLLVRSANWLAVGAALVLIGLLVALAMLIGAVILPKLARLVLRVPRFLMVVTLAGLAFAFMNTVGFSDLGLPLALVGLVGAAGLIGAAIGSLRCTGWRALGGDRRAVVLAGLAIGCAGVVGLGHLLAFPGAAIAPPPAGEAGPGAAQPLELPDPSLPGPYAVETFTYGSGEDRQRPEYASEADWISESVDGSAFVSGWTGLTKLGRDLYWGFGPDQLPLNGRVWAPAGEGPFPIVLIVHGNHTAESFSDGGYAYLGQLLAGRGFVVVSVDENFLNTAASDVLTGPGGTLARENDARGWLLLEHLRAWRGWAIDPTHPFYGRVDLERVGLIGHSRGGEAVAVAAAFSRLPAYPDDASVTFDFGFGIRAVIAIAPVDSQYRPSGVLTPLEDVSYFSIHGAHDEDMRSFHGSIQYGRVALSPGSAAFKALLYVYGANHGQFNSDWGRLDLAGMPGRLLNTRNLMPEAQQQQIAKVMLSAFLEATLHDQAGYRALFQDHRAGLRWLPEGIYISRYADARTQLLSGYEEDLDVRTGTLAGVTQAGAGLETWQERMVEIKWGSLGSKAVLLGWGAEHSGAAYTIAVGEGALELAPEASLVFSMADCDPSKAEGREPIDLTLELTDAEGDTARLPLSHVAQLQPQLRAQITKIPWTNKTPVSELVYQSYAFRLADFAAANAAFDPTELVEIRFVFDLSPEGRVALDDVGIR